MLSKQDNSVFSTLVQVSTSSNTIVHVPSPSTGANSCFMDRDFSSTHKIALEKLPCPTSMIVIDGQPIASSNIVGEAKLV